jgi:hypothetical protein
MAMPCPRADGVGNDGGEDAIEIKEEEDSDEPSDDKKDEELTVSAMSAVVSRNKVARRVLLAESWMPAGFISIPGAIEDAHREVPAAPGDFPSSPTTS